MNNNNNNNNNYNKRSFDINPLKTLLNKYPNAKTLQDLNVRQLKEEARSRDLPYTKQHTKKKCIDCYIKLFFWTNIKMWV